MTALYVANGLTRTCKFETNLDYNAYFDLSYLQKAGVYGQLDEWAVMARELMYHDN